MEIHGFNTAHQTHTITHSACCVVNFLHGYIFLNLFNAILFKKRATLQVDNGILSSLCRAKNYNINMIYDMILNTQYSYDNMLLLCSSSSVILMT